MSFFLPDDNQPKKKPKGVVDYNWVTGAPIYESRTQSKAERSYRPSPQKPVSFRENYETVKNIGKGIHHAYKASKQHYSPNRLPYDVDRTIERAKQLKQQEKKGEEYRKAQEYITDFESRRMEYEANHPRSFKDKLLGRRRLY